MRFANCACAREKREKIGRLPGGQWYAERDAVSNAIDHAKFYSRSHNAVIRVYDETGNVIEAHEQPGDFKE
jgi:hypothetical protein